MKNKKEFIDVQLGDENCPADALMNDFRKRANSANDYAKNIEFSKSCIDFFKKMADIVEESDNIIKFRWYEIPEKELPALIVKVRQSNGKFYLQYLKELGEEKTIIKGKQRKGKNRNGKIEINKGEER